METKNHGIIYGVKYWLPTDQEIQGNVHVNYPNSRNIRENIHHTLGIVDAMEPDYYTGGTVLRIEDINAADMINYKLKTCVKCNGIVTPKSFMKENHMGVFGRSSDCLMAAIITTHDVWMLHVSAEALNNGIMLNIPTFKLTSRKPQAILGPCISQKNYSLYKDVAETRLSNYETLGYNDFLYEENDKIHVDIKGIVIQELLKRNVQIAYNDFRCTYKSNLGSHRLKNNRANPIYLWVD